MAPFSHWVLKPTIPVCQCPVSKMVTTMNDKQFTETLNSVRVNSAAMWKALHDCFVAAIEANKEHANVDRINRVINTTGKCISKGKATQLTKLARTMVPHEFKGGKFGKRKPGAKQLERAATAITEWKATRQTLKVTLELMEDVVKPELSEEEKLAKLAKQAAGAILKMQDLGMTLPQALAAIRAELEKNAEKAPGNVVAIAA